MVHLKALRSKIIIDRAHKSSSGDYCGQLLEILKGIFQYDKVVLITCKRDVVCKPWTGDDTHDEFYDKDLSKEIRKVGLKTLLGKICELTESMHEFELVNELIGPGKSVFCYRCNDNMSSSPTSLFYFFAYEVHNLFQLIIKE